MKRAKTNTQERSRPPVLRNTGDALTRARREKKKKRAREKIAYTPAANNNAHLVLPVRLRTYDGLQPRTGAGNKKRRKGKNVTVGGRTVTQES